MTAFSTQALLNLLRSFGGIQYIQDGADAADPDNIVMNFGMAGDPGIEGIKVESTNPSVYDLAPQIQGIWDGKTNICPNDAVRKVTGGDLPPQNQPEGTCGSRAGSNAGDLLQCGLIAAGLVNAKFHRVSHAWIYGNARKMYNMRGMSAGVASGSIGPCLHLKGLLTRTEAKDENFAGPGSDDLAVKWGNNWSWPTEYEQMAADNLMTGMLKVNSFQEYADATMSGMIGVVSSDRGYTMTRDPNGVCIPSGTWYHYMTFAGVIVLPSGERIIPCWQSWGNQPGGPKLEQGRYPVNVFGVREQDFMRHIQGGALHMMAGMQIWEDGPKPMIINWVDTFGS